MERLEILSRIEFANPEAFWLLFAIPLVAALFIWFSARRDRNTARILKVSHSPKQYIALSALWSLVLVGLIGVAANPQIVTYGKESDPVYGDYVFLVDTSLSMGASPAPYEESRLDRAKDIMKRVSADMPARFLVFGYSGVAEPLSSFIEDQAELNSIIEHSLYLEVFPRHGSDMAHALARVAHEKEENPHYSNVTHIVLFSDGKLSDGYGERIEEALEKTRQAGLTVVAVGVGAGSPERVPFYDEEGNFTGQFYKVRETGNDYTGILQEDNLRNISSSVGGRYFHESQAEGLIEYLLSTLPDNPLDIDSETVTLGSRSIAWIFTLVSIFAFAIILANSRRFYG